MATSEQIEKIRAALAELNGALNAAKDGGEAQSGVRTLAEEPADTSDTKEYLGEAGLKRLVELVSDALKAKKDSFSEGYGLALEDGVLKVTLDTSLFVVVRELPTEPTVEDEGKLHLVPMGETEEGNEYAEYLWVNGAWELMGTLHTKVDLSDYLPLTGGTLTGDLKVGGATTLSLTEKDDAESVVVADPAGKLYSMPVSALSGGSSGTSGGHTGACDGVFVAYVDYDGVRRICSAAEWSDSLGAAQGVMVGDGSHELLLAPTQASSTKYWSDNYELVGGIITTTSSSAAQKDFNGKLNSDGIAAMGGDYLSDSYAPGFCRSYAYGAVPAGEWWLPSCGELYGLIYGHKSDVDDALAAIGATALTNGSYWSSTQSGSGIAWTVSMGNGNVYNDTKDYNHYVRAVAAFDYEL